MSYDARYIFVYDDLGYLPPTPMEKDIEYLKEKYGGEFIRFEETSTFGTNQNILFLMKN